MKLFSRSILAVLLLFGMVFTLSAGGQQDQDQEVPEGVVELDVISDLQWSSDPMKSEEYKVYNALAMEQGFSINWIMPPHSNYIEKLNVLFASGDLPDVVWDDRLHDRAASGYLLPLNDYVAMDKYADQFDGFISDAAWDLVTLGDDILALPTPRGDVGRRGDMIRSDWLENLDLEMPETIDDIKEVLHAFTYDDPDGNGKDDTYGASFRKDLGWFDGFHGAFDLQSYWWPAYYMPVDDIDGKLVCQYTQEKFRDYLAFMAELWADGVFDPNSFLNAGSQWGEMWKTGKTGYIHHYSYRAKSNFTKQTVDISENPDADWEAVIPHISGPYGQGSTRDRPSGRFLMISNTSENPDAAMDFITWSTVTVENPELQEFLKWGLEDKHYKVVDGERVRNPILWNYATDEAAKLGDESLFDESVQTPTYGNLNAFAFYGIIDDDPEWEAAQYGEYGAYALDGNRKYALDLNTLMLGKPILDEEENIPEMRKIVLEYMTKAITGNQDVDEGFAKMKKELNNVGFQEMMDARQAWYDANRK